MKISGLYPSPSDLDRIDASATAALSAGAEPNEKTWLGAVRQAQPQFDWSKYPVVIARYRSWLERAWPLALQQKIGKHQTLWQHGQYTALARHNEQVYVKTNDELRLILESEQRVGLIEEFEIFSDTRWQLRSFGYILRGDAYLIFRGTVVSSLRNWVLNARCAENEPGVHCGFLVGWHQLERQMRDWLKKLDPQPKRLTLSGHSLGGAMAVLAAYELSAAYPIRNVVTFGSPSLSTEKFAALYSAAGLTPVTRRYIHETDIIPRLVPSFLYSHLGEDYFITKEGEIVEETTDPPFSKRLYDRFQKSDNAQIGLGYVGRLLSLVSPLNSTSPGVVANAPTPTVEMFVKTAASSLPQYAIYAMGALAALWSLICVFGLACFGAITVRGDIERHAMNGYARALDFVAKKSIEALGSKLFGAFS